MGFLDHSTNNIIIDAVLTDYGRKLLAENQGAFQIAFFSLGDDEVDYSTIKKFGRIVGKEKVVKNTPIFEAQTSHMRAIKNRLITLPDPLVSKMPRLTLDPTTQATNSIVDLGTNNSITMTFAQKQGNDETPAEGLGDTTYTFLVNDRFLTVSGGPIKLSTEANTKTAAWSISSDPSTQQISVTVVKKSFDADTTFNQFGVNGTITTPIALIGDQTGLRIDLKMTLKKTS